MNNLWQKINEDLKSAVRDHKEEEKAVLRMLLASLKNRMIENKSDSRDNLDDAEVIQVLKAEIKKRNDSIELYRQGKREDLVGREEAEIKILKKYMPEMMAEDEIELVVKKVADSLPSQEKKNFGQVMGLVMKELASRADGKIVRQIVQKVISEN